MANKWKYSSLPAEERIGMIRKGDKDVYANEVDRALDVIKTRESLGLDTTDQKDWIDNISYNYNLYNAERMGISPNNVNKTGYADKILASGTQEGKNRKYVTTVGGKNAEKNYKANKLLEEFEQKINDAKSTIANLREWLLNNGIDQDSQDGKKYIDSFNDELEATTEKLRAQYISKIKALF